MIYWVRVAEITGPEAMEWEVKVADLVNSKFPNTTQVLRNLSGNVQQVRWLATAESLAEIERRMADIQADAGYQALLAEARSNGYFVQGSVSDSYFRTVP